MKRLENQITMLLNILNQEKKSHPCFPADNLLFNDIFLYFSFKQAEFCCTPCTASSPPIRTVDIEKGRDARGEEPVPNSTLRQQQQKTNLVSTTKSISAPPSSLHKKHQHKKQVEVVEPARLREEREKTRNFPPRAFITPPSLGLDGQRK